MEAGPWNGVKLVNPQSKAECYEATGAGIATKNGAQTGVGTTTVYDISKLQNTGNFRSGALNHILNGDVKANGISGYHYEGMPTPNASTVAGTASTPNSYGVYSAQVTGKTANGGMSTFFPKSMTPQQIVDNINEAYTNKVQITGNTYQGVASSGMTIEMYLDSGGQIISAFPK